MRLLLPCLLVLTFSASCGKLRLFNLKSSEQKQDISQIYAAGNLKVSVFYEPGAEPYTDGVAGIKVWNVLEQNLKALFPGKNIIVPKDLSAMSPLSSLNKSTWSNSEIKVLGDNFGEGSTTDTSVFNVFFVKGHAEGTNGQYVIGLHLSGTKTLMVFKETVEASDTSANSTVVKRYVEQSTLVHEVGHALGLVNNGVAMSTTHEDPTHHAHCNNPNCVMYWENEGAAALKNFIQNRLTNPNLVMYDQACIQDVTSYQK